MSSCAILTGARRAFHVLCRWLRRAPLLIIVSLPPAGALAQAVQSLPAFDVDIAQSSVSGLSAGGYMAMQFEVAFSSILKGAGIIAGGPYYCAQGNQTTATSVCSCVPFGCFGASTTNVPDLIRITDRSAAQGLIDATSSLRNGRFWLFSGTADTAVPQRIMDDLKTYLLHYVDSGNIFYKNDLAAEHAQPTDFFGNPCNVRNDPFINNCNYDAASELLHSIYGTLRPRNTGQLQGSFIEFDQSEFLANPTSHGLADTGWLFVPTDCANGQACRLHIVFHGCKQFQTYRYFSPGAGMVTFGTTFVRNTGYNKWADTNSIIVLYPQATTTSSNPFGCWDWWAYDDPNYATKTGRQMAAVRQMMGRIASGAASLPAPTGLNRTNATDTSISLSWSPVPSASGFNVYRNDARANGSRIAGTTFTDSSLAPGTTYGFQVRGVDAAGREGASSAILQASTTGTASVVPPPTGLSVGEVKSDSVALSWTAPQGVAGFDVFRGTIAGGPYAKVNASLVTQPRFTDTKLAADTTYFYVVRSNNASVLSVTSNEVSAKTSGAAVCFTATNFDHVQAGRAHDQFFLALANGSNDVMGLDNVFIVTTLKETKPGSFMVATCP
jgi:poly(3-hydroxybutyrate) depolymerase/chitodextrinase